MSSSTLCQSDNNTPCTNKSRLFLCIILILRMLCRWLTCLPTYPQNFLFAKPFIEEFLEHLLIARTIGNSSPS